MLYGGWLKWFKLVEHTSETVRVIWCLLAETQLLENILNDLEPA